MRLTHYDECKKRWQINADYGAVMIDGLNYAVGEAIDKLAAYEDAEEQGLLVPVRHGRWLIKTVRGDKRTVCSECLIESGTCYEDNYCPNCGARMDLKEN